MGNPSAPGSPSDDDRALPARLSLASTWLLISTAASTLGGIVALRLLTGALGSSNYGSYLTTLTVLSVFSLATDLGASAITGRELARHPHLAGELLAKALGFRLLLCLAASPLLALCALLLYRHQPTVQIGLVIGAVTVPLGAAAVLLTSYFNAQLRTWVSSLAAVVKTIVYVASTAVALALHTGVVGCLVAFTFTSTVYALALLLMTRREVAVRAQFASSSWRSTLRESIQVGAIQVIDVLYLKADLLLIGWLRTPAQVGIYGVAYTVINAFNLVPSAIMTAIFAVMSRSSASELRGRVVATAKVLVSLGVLAAVGGLVLGPSVVLAISGPSFGGAAAPLRLLSIACIATFATRSLSFTLVAQSQTDGLLAISIGGLVVNVALNISLIPTFGITGAAVATLVSEAGVLVATALRFRLATGVHLPIFEVALRPMAAAIPVTAMGFLLLPHGTSKLLVLVAMAGLLATAYLAILGALGGIPRELLDLRPSRMELPSRWIRRRGAGTKP